MLDSQVKVTSTKLPSLTQPQPILSTKPYTPEHFSAQFAHKQLIPWVCSYNKSSWNNSRPEKPHQALQFTSSSSSLDPTGGSPLGSLSARHNCPETTASSKTMGTSQLPQKGSQAKNPSWSEQSIWAIARKRAPCGNCHYLCPGLKTESHGITVTNQSIWGHHGMNSS